MTWQKAFDDLRKGWNDPKRELRDFSFDQNVVVSGTKPVLLSVKNETSEEVVDESEIEISSRKRKHRQKYLFNGAALC
mgnify:FL=1